MSGIATLTILESSTAMIVPVRTVPATIHLCGAWRGNSELMPNANRVVLPSRFRIVRSIRGTRETRQQAAECDYIRLGPVAEFLPESFALARPRGRQTSTSLRGELEELHSRAGGIRHSPQQRLSFQIGQLSADRGLVQAVLCLLYTS